MGRKFFYTAYAAQMPLSHIHDPEKACIALYPCSSWILIQSISLPKYFVYPLISLRHQIK